MFDVLQQAANRQVIRHLADTSLSPMGRPEYRLHCLFDGAYVAEVDGLMASSGPAVTVDSAQAESLGLVQGSVIQVAGRGWFTVVEPMPDGAGLTVLRLRGGA